MRFRDLLKSPCIWTLWHTDTLSKSGILYSDPDRNIKLPLFLLFWFFHNPWFRRMSVISLYVFVCIDVYMCVNMFVCLLICLCAFPKWMFWWWWVIIWKIQTSSGKLGLLQFILLIAIIWEVWISIKTHKKRSKFFFLLC